MILSKDVAHSSHNYVTQSPDLPHPERQTPLHPTTHNPTMWLARIILMPYFVIPVSFVLIFLGITLDTTYQKYLTPTPTTELDSQTELNDGNSERDSSQINQPIAEGIIDELTSATQRTHDTRYKMLRNTLMLEAELYYMSNNMTYQGFCNSPRTLEHIMTQAEPAGEVICFDDNQNYAIAIKLTSGEYYCIDSDVKESQSTTPPSSSMCQE